MHDSRSSRERQLGGRATEPRDTPRLAGAQCGCKASDLLRYVVKVTIATGRKGATQAIVTVGKYSIQTRISSFGRYIIVSITAGEVDLSLFHRGGLRTHLFILPTLGVSVSSCACLAACFVHGACLLS